MTSPERWDDALMDGLALVELFRRDDETTSPGVAAILRANSMCMADTALSLAKLLAEAAGDLDVDPVHFRRWAAQAVKRPLCSASAAPRR